MTSKRHLAGQFAASTVFWIFVTALFAFQMWSLASTEGVRINFRSVLVWQAGFYVLWIPMTVLVWRLTAAATPSLLGWPRYLLQNAGLLILVSVVHSLLVMGVATAILGRQSEPLGQMLLGQLRGRSYFEALIYAGVVAAGHAVWLYDQWREREMQAARLEVQLASAQLSNLQAQLHPHFLFNSLHAVASLARDGRQSDVVKTLADLSDLLRRVTDPQTPTVPLSQEVELARRYLDIQQVRFEHKLRVDIDIAAGADTVQVPALTLQPLVDNAVRHGLAASVRGGTVRVTARVLGESLQLRVEDDGAGVPSGWDEAAVQGTGLANLRTRLGILYGDRGSIAAGPAQGGGFSVTVTVPVHAEVRTS
ncbi:MAG TPA: histidine kinase [Vicinamibacterales bacterium]|nr:histidine kinase [Vicinamibacterales bacterium]